jgi:hypothetical protein
VGGVGRRRTRTRRSRSAGAALIAAGDPAKEIIAMPRFFNLATVASFAALGLMLAGIISFTGGRWRRRSCTTSSRRRRSSSRPPARSCPADLKQYAGAQVDTASEAKAFADGYIWCT